MKLHANARLSVKGRELLVDRVEHAGWSVIRAAEAGGITERTAALPGWIDFYNHKRPHGALSHKPPIARLNELNNLLGSYS